MDAETWQSDHCTLYVPSSFLFVTLPMCGSKRRPHSTRQRAGNSKCIPPSLLLPAICSQGLANWPYRHTAMPRYWSPATVACRLYRYLVNFTGRYSSRFLLQPVTRCCSVPTVPFTYFHFIISNTSNLGHTNAYVLGEYHLLSNSSTSSHPFSRFPCWLSTARLLRREARVSSRLRARTNLCPSYSFPLC